MYLDAEDIESPNLTDSIYTFGTLKVHHVRRLNTNIIDLYLNNTFNKSSDVFKSSTREEKNGKEEDDDGEKMKFIKLLFKQEETDNFSYVYFFSFPGMYLRDTGPSSLTWIREICFKYKPRILFYF